MRLVSSIVFLALAAHIVHAQGTRKPVYMESFRKGNLRVTEMTLELNLDTRNPRSKARIQDATGRDRYELTFEPQIAGPNDSRVVSWHAALADLRHQMYKNVLAPSIDPLLDSQKVWWFTPNPYANIGLETQRVVKVEQFYCSMQVTDHHAAAPGDPRLESMTVKVSFTNSNPLEQEPARH